jgi:hypothetical protein
LDLSRRVGRGEIWRRQWELLTNSVYNKPNGCSATGTLTPGPDHQQQQQIQKRNSYVEITSVLPSLFVWLFISYSSIIPVFTHLTAEAICNKVSRGRCLSYYSAHQLYFIEGRNEIFSILCVIIDGIWAETRKIILLII